MVENKSNKRIAVLNMSEGLHFKIMTVEEYKKSYDVEIPTMIMDNALMAEVVNAIHSNILLTKSEEQYASDAKQYMLGL